MTAKRPFLYWSISLLLATCLISNSRLNAQIDGVFTSLDLAIESPDSVRVLNLNGEKLRTFPEEILSFSNLEELHLKRCKLSETMDVSTLKKLRVLNLAYNKLSKFPVGLFELHKLEYLDLGHNEIDTITSAIGELSALKELVLWGNYFRSIPEEIKLLSQLQMIDLRMIELSALRQKEITEWLSSDVKIHFSIPCNCGN